MERCLDLGPQFRPEFAPCDQRCHGHIVALVFDRSTKVSVWWMATGQHDLVSIESSRKRWAGLYFGIPRGDGRDLGSLLQIALVISIARRHDWRRPFMGIAEASLYAF